MTKSLLCFGLWLLSSACASGASSTNSSNGGGDTSPSTVTASLPDFELDTLGGETLRLSDQLGKKVILLDFWATFCDPCLLAMPHLNDLYKKYESQGFVILGVSVDGPESLSRVRSEVRKMGVEFPILLDPETEALALYNPKTSAPYSILIDRQGNIVKKKEGFSPADVPVLEQAIADALSR
jgi:peroxiredoxin